MIQKETIDKIILTSRIEEIISEFIELKRSGSNLKGLSPFSNEKTPSFIVSPSKQIWKDFSSGKGGNVISFLMEYEHLSYIEAIKYLAQRYNIEIIENKQIIPYQNQYEKKNKENLYLIHKIAIKFFRKQIWNSEEGKFFGLNYFKSRSFSDEIINKFHLGYSPIFKSSFLDFLIKIGFDQNSIEKSGLFFYNKFNKFIDRFHSRVIFPIFDISGHIIGFGGRTLSSNKNTIKYLNSPETEIYHKSKVLYGLYQSKTLIIKKNHCFIVEGYTDVISLYQKGIQNVVSPLGTSITEDQILLIKKFTENITILFDGDEPGKQAAFRIIDLLLQKEINVKILILPNNQDPDSFAKKYTTKEIEDFIYKNSTNFIEFKVNFFQKCQKDLIKKYEMIKSIISSIRLINDYIKKEIYIQEAANILNISQEIFYKELDLYENIKIKNVKKIVEKKNNIFYNKYSNINNNSRNKLLDIQLIYEADLIKTILRYGNYLIEPKYLNKQRNYKISVAEEIIKQLEADDIKFKSTFYQKIFQDISNGLKKGKLKTAEFYSTSTDPEISKKAIDSLHEEYKLSKNWKNKGIYINNKESKVTNLVTDLILRYKTLVMNEIIHQLSLKIQSEKAKTNEIYRKNLYKQLLSIIEIKNKILSRELNQVITPSIK